MIDLCASCVATVCDHNTPTRAENSRDSWAVRDMTPGLAREIEAGEVLIGLPAVSRYLPMVAVTTVNGSRLCGDCAREAYNSRGARW